MRQTEQSNKVIHPKKKREKNSKNLLFSNFQYKSFEKGLYRVGKNKTCVGGGKKKKKRSETEGIIIFHVRPNPEFSRITQKVPARVFHWRG